MTNMESGEGRQSPAELSKSRNVAGRLAKSEKKKKERKRNRREFDERNAGLNSRGEKDHEEWHA